MVRDVESNPLVTYGLIGLLGLGPEPGVGLFGSPHSQPKLFEQVPRK